MDVRVEKDGRSLCVVACPMTSRYLSLETGENFTCKPCDYHQGLGLEPIESFGDLKVFRTVKCTFPIMEQSEGDIMRYQELVQQGPPARVDTERVVYNPRKTTA